MYGKKASNGAVPSLRKGRQPAAKPPAARAKQVWRAKRPAVDARIGAALLVPITVLL
jgi:hypothetical protein